MVVGEEVLGESAMRTVDMGSEVETGEGLVRRSSGGSFPLRLGSDMDGWRTNTRFRSKGVVLSSKATVATVSLLFFFLVRLSFQSLTTLKRGVEERWLTRVLAGLSLLKSTRLFTGMGGKMRSPPCAGRQAEDLLLLEGGITLSSREEAWLRTRGGTIMERGRGLRAGAER